MRNTRIKDSSRGFISACAIMISILFFKNAIYPQTPEFVWVKQVNEPDNQGWGIATDNSGNSIVTGWFEGTETFDMTTLTSAGEEDIFVAKYDPSGNVLWAKQAGGTLMDYGYSVATDRLDNIIVTGSFFIAATFDTINLIGAGAADIFIAKYDASGNVLWAKRAGGSGASYDCGNGIATDGLGNSIITGHFEGTADFGSTTLTSAGEQDIFVAKYDPSGNMLWVKSAGGTGFDYGKGIATDWSGNVVVTGDFQGTANFDTTTLISAHWSDIFIARYDPSGNMLWAKSAGGTHDDYGEAIVADGSGNTIVTGRFNETATFDLITLTSAGSYDIFVAKYDSLGSILWAKRAGGASANAAGAITTYGPDNYFITGIFRETAAFDTIVVTSYEETWDMFIAKYDRSGNVRWVAQANGPGWVFGNGIATDRWGNSIVTGFYEGWATFGTILLNGGGFFIAKLPGVHVVIPNTTTQPNTIVNIPIIITDVTGMGIEAAEIELSWDSSVLDNASAAPGVIVPSDWSFNYTSVPGSGQMTISMESTDGGSPPTDELTGSGSLVMLTFEVVGQDGDTTTLHFDEMLFNEGEPSALIDDGFFKIFAGWDIIGNIAYALNGDPVDDAVVPAMGILYIDTTDTNGDYELLDLLPGNYLVKPEKEDDLGIPSAISAFDAAWILQYSVELRTFSPYQMIAGDVTGNGSVSAFDAARILQYNVGLINKFEIMPDTSHFWRFVPEDFPINPTNWTTAPDSIAYTPLNSDTTDNYVGITYGDVSGNWHPSAAELALLGKSSGETVDIRLDDVYGQKGETINLPVILEHDSDILAVSFTLEYDANLLKAMNASTSELTEGWQMAHNIGNGQMKVALAGSQPITTSGTILKLEFQVLQTELGDATSPLEISEIMVNEGTVSVNIQSAKFTTGAALPKEYALSQNFPNPFNSQTVIKYQLPKAGRVVLKIYNTLGQELRTLVDEEMKAGYHQISWDGLSDNGSRVSSGIYIYRIQAGDFVKVRKMLFIM